MAYPLWILSILAILVIIIAISNAIIASFRQNDVSKKHKRPETEVEGVDLSHERRDLTAVAVNSGLLAIILLILVILVVVSWR